LNLTGAKNKKGRFIADSDPSLSILVDLSPTKILGGTTEKEKNND